MRKLLLWYLPQAALLATLTTAWAEERGPMVKAFDAYNDCVVLKTVDRIANGGRPDPESAFADCQTEEQAVLAMADLIRSDRLRTVVVAKFYTEKLKLKNEIDTWSKR